MKLTINTKRTILVDIGQYAINEAKYDAVGMSEDEEVLSIGFQNNDKPSILLAFKDDNLEVSFHEKISKYEAFTFWFQIGEKIKCSVIITNDFK